MNRQVGWIKTVVGLCFREFETEKEKKAYFIRMEEEYLQFTEDEKVTVRNIMMTQFEARDIIYVLSAMVQNMNVKDFQEDLMENILRGNFDGCVGSMLEYQSLIYVDGEYKRKRILNKKNTLNYGEILKMKYAYIPVEKRNKKRIVIITGQLLSILHSPTAVILNMAYALQYLGYEIMLFICPCNGVLPEDLWYQQRLVEGSINEWENAPVRIEYRGMEFLGYQISMSLSGIKEYGMMLSLIHAWNPIFVLDADTTNSVVGLAGTFTTLVSWTMSIRAPISDGDILVRLGKMEEKIEKNYIEAMEKHQKQLFMKEKFPVITETAKNNYVRAELGLPEEQFLVAIVGNRLDAEISEEFVCLLKKVLEKIQNIAFVIIGDSVGIKQYFEDEIFKRHVYYLGFCSDLMGIYRLLDLYLNPKRMGGGFSGGMALQAGLPVLTLPDCDVAYNCGEDFVVQDFEEMGETLCLCATNQKFYSEKKEYVKKYNEEDRDKKLICFMEELLEGIYGIMGLNL